MRTTNNGKPIIEVGGRSVLRQDLLFNGLLLISAGEPVQVQELIGERGVRVATIGQSHIVTVPALYRALCEPAAVAIA